jgi:cystathionine gamma-lyase
MAHRPETQVIHAGQSPRARTGAVMQPVFQTSTYAQAWPAKHTGYEYARTHNPTREALERCVAALEAARTGSRSVGLGATEAVLHTLPRPTPGWCAATTSTAAPTACSPRCSRSAACSSRSSTSAHPARRGHPRAGTNLVWLESPTNPLLKMSRHRARSPPGPTPWAPGRGRQHLRHADLPAPAGARRRPRRALHHQVPQRPQRRRRRHRAHRVRRPARAAPVHPERRRRVPGPWDTWLTLRGVKTLAVRMARHQENARKVVDWLVPTPRSRACTTRCSSPTRVRIVASKQMSGFGGMISFVLDATSPAPRSSAPPRSCSPAPSRSAASRA